MKADKSSNAANMRGTAYSTVTIYTDSTVVTGVLKDGTQHGYTLLTFNSSISDDKETSKDDGAKIAASLVGRQMKDDSWVKTVVNGSAPMSAKGHGYALDIAILTNEEVMKNLKDEFKFKEGSVTTQLDNLKAFIWRDGKKDGEKKA
jgi:hypothetical protein